MKYRNSDIVVITPIYKNHLNHFEQTSLDFCKKHLHAYHHIVIAPFSLAKDKQFNSIVQNENMKVVFFDNKFFNGIAGYNKLMLNLKFYKTFANYEYMLIYQLDALVFSDQLLNWVNKNYDYIGAPWLLEGTTTVLDSAGNGGFSLRKITSFLNVLESKDFYYTEANYYTLSLRTNIWNIFMIKLVNKIQQSILPVNPLRLFLFFYRGNEDYFWTFYAKFFTQKFLIPTVTESLRFSIEANPPFCYKCNHKSLPFGAHAWYKHDLEFWLKTIDGLETALTKNAKA